MSRNGGTKSTLRDAYAPYLAQLRLCACATCRAVNEQRVEVGGQWLLRDPSAYWAAVSDQLQQLMSGGHQRVEWSDYVRGLPGYDPQQLATPIRGFDVGRDGGLDGIGLGVGGHIVCAPVRVSAGLTVADEPGQLALFEAAA